METKDVTLLQMKKKLAMMDSFIETILDEIGDAVYYQDKNLIYRFFNEDYLEMVDKKEAEVCGHSIFDVFPKEEAEVYHKDDLAVLTSGIKKSYETVIDHPMRAKRIIQVIKRPHINEDGEILGILGIIKDVTSIREKQRQLKMLDDVKSLFLEINRNILKYKSEHEFFDDIQMEIQSVFKQCKQSSVLKINEKNEMTILVYRGYLDEEASKFHLPLTESYLYKHSHGNFDEAFYINDIQTYIKNSDVPIISSKEEKLVKSSLCIPLMLENQLKYLISIDSNEIEAFDKSDQIVAEFISKELSIIYQVFEFHKEAVKLSKYDELTDLYNRRTFNYVSDNTIKHLRPGEKFAMVLIDIDRLKKINDRYGHLAGDKYIKELVEGIKELMNENINFGRIGGDEFAGYFAGYDYEVVDDLLEKLQKNFRCKVVQIEDNSFNGSFSYGLAHLGVDGDERSELMKVADLRMYKNKYGRFKNY